MGTVATTGRAAALVGRVGRGGRSLDAGSPRRFGLSSVGVSPVRDVIQGAAASGRPATVRGERAARLVTGDAASERGDLSAFDEATGELVYEEEIASDFEFAILDGILNDDERDTAYEIRRG